MAWWGWAAFIVVSGLSWLDRRYYNVQLEQKDNCIKLWRAENERTWGKLADSEQTVILLEHEIERLRPKHGKDGKFTRRG